MSENFGVEDFEKIDPEQADQDTNITSTSMTGEMAEEDRYTGLTNDNDLLGDFAGGMTGAAVESLGNATSGFGQPLMSFDTSEAVAEELEPESFIPPVKPTSAPAAEKTSTDGSGNNTPSICTIIRL